MGNSQPNSINKDYQQHPRLGTISVTQKYNHQTNKYIEMMELSRSLHSQNILNDWRAFIVKINDSEIRQVILLPDKYSFEKHGMCSASGKLNVSFQYFPYTLTNEISNRSGLNKYFEQKQIWYLFYNLIRAANKFQRINKKIGNIHPDNVLINSIGQVKIFAACSLPGERNNFQLMAENILSNAYLAPQQLANDAIKGSHYPLHVNHCLAETFSIGLTVLTAGTLLQCQNLYQRHKNSLKFNFTGLESILSVFRQIYSQQLYDMLQSILQTNPMNRKSASQIYQQLYQYEREILNLEDFLPRQKIKQKIKHQQNKDSNYYHIANDNNSQQRKLLLAKNNKVKSVYQQGYNSNHQQLYNQQQQYQQQQQQLSLNHMEQTRRIHQNLQHSKHLNSNLNNNHNLSPQLTGTFSFHHNAANTMTQKVIVNPPQIVNTQRIISSPVIRFQSPPPQQPIQQQSRSPPSILPGPLYSTNNIKSRISTSPIPNSKIIYQQTKILPPIRPMNSQLARNTLPVVSHIVKNLQNPESNFIKNDNNPIQNHNQISQIRNEQQKTLNDPVVSNQNISTIKTIPINSVIHTAASNKAINNKVKTKLSTQGMFLPLQSLRVINSQDYKSENKIPVNIVNQSQDGKVQKTYCQQQNNHIENENNNESQFIDSIKEQTTQNQKQIQTTQKQIPLDSKLISFEKIQ